MDFQLAGEAFMEALGDGLWRDFVDAKAQSSFRNVEQSDVSGERFSPSRKVQSSLINSALYPIDASSSLHQPRDFQLFHRLEEQGTSVELPWNKVSTLFNFARVLEQMHDTEMASIFYRLILFKVCMVTLLTSLSDRYYGH